MKLSSKLALLVSGSLMVASGGVLAQEQCTIKIGRVVPITGPLADYGKVTPWVDKNKVDPINAAGGLAVGDKKCKIEYEIYDSRSTT